jgi:glutaredoxin
VNEGASGAARVVLFTIPGLCPLCDEARELLHREAVEFEEVDIRTDRALLRAYRLEIPVVTVDGRKEFVGRIDPERLRRLLANREPT